MHEAVCRDLLALVDRAQRVADGRSGDDEHEVFIEMVDALTACAQLVPGVCSYLDVSTGHITELEMLRLSAGGVSDLSVPRVIPHEYGAWVHVRCSEVEDDDVCREDALLGVNVAVVLRRARELGCSWVNFDRDAEPLDGLPTFDW